jgi:hypothetical protein
VSFHHGNCVDEIGLAYDAEGLGAQEARARKNLDSVPLKFRKRLGHVFRWRPKICTEGDDDHAGP